MKIIYAKKSSGIDEQGSFQNPEYYDKPNTAAESVVIYGDYPKIKADYEELSVGVEVRELPKTKPLTVGVSVGITPELQATIDQAKAECEKVVAENAKLKTQLEQLAGVVAERDALAAKVELLELQAAEFKQSNTGASGSLSESNDLFEEKPKDPKTKK